VTRSFDATRILTMACIATIADVVMRKEVADTPRLSSEYYSGRAAGPIHAFGFDIGQFARESANLLFMVPEMATTRSLILDYFEQQTATGLVSPERFIFNFEGGYFGLAERRWLEQLALSIGLPTHSLHLYLTGADADIYDNYPEIMVLRDIVFYFKLLMAPGGDKLP